MISSRNYFLREIRRCITRRFISQNNDFMCRPNSKVGVKNLDSNAPERSFGNEKWPVHSRLNHIRTLVTAPTKVKPLTYTSLDFSNEDTKYFLAVFPEIVRDLTDDGRHTDIEEANKRFSKMLEYNVLHGKLIRGLSTVAAYKLFEKPENLTSENIRAANVLGWCVELLHASCFVQDDIMDGSELRRGQPCWYKNEGVGLFAINDGILLENSSYTILKKHFSNRQCYVPILELFNDVTIKRALGQLLDCLSLDNGKPRLDLFTLKRYKSIVKFKSSYYSFKLPLVLGMYLSNVYDEEQHRQAETILLELGECFQIQDDFIDAFGHPAKTDKIGSDIQDGKCTWLAVTALKRANPAQRKLIEEHYGRQDHESVQIIKQLYEKIDLLNIYSAYQEDSFNTINKHIRQVPKGALQDFFFKNLTSVMRLHSINA